MSRSNNVTYQSVAEICHQLLAIGEKQFQLFTGMLHAPMKTEERPTIVCQALAIAARVP